MNPVIEKLVAELDRAMFGEPWFGASVKNVLDSTTYTKAFAAQSENVHTIAEIALHILAWNEEIISRLEGNDPKEPAIGDWPWVKYNDEIYWDEIRKQIYGAHTRLINIVKSFPFEKFEEQIGKEHRPELATGFSYRESLLGLMQHNIYHAGQIAILKKLI